MEDLRQQHNSNNRTDGSNAQVIIEQISQVISPPHFSSSCSPPQDSHVNESQSISLDEAISLHVSTASRRETSDLWNRIRPFSILSVVVDTSQIKHTDDGSNDNLFWQIFDELQNESPDNKTVNGQWQRAIET